MKEWRKTLAQETGDNSMIISQGLLEVGITGVFHVACLDRLRVTAIKIQKGFLCLAYAVYYARIHLKEFLTSILPPMQSNMALLGLYEEPLAKVCVTEWDSCDVEELE